MSSAVNYGAVEAADDHVTEEFDGRYLEEPTLTKEQRIRKLTLVVVPLLAAVLIVGGAALFLFRDFDNLYPGHHSSGKEPAIRIHASSSTTSSSSASDSSEQTTGTSTAPVNEKKDESHLSTSCLAHEKCKGLMGECCPTLEGTFLSCCN